MRNYLFVFLILFLLINSGCFENSNDIKASGTVEATEVNIAAKVTGRVESFTKEGEGVSKGQEIIWLDREELTQQVAQMEAALKAAKIQLQQSLKLAELQKSQVGNQIEVTQSSIVSTEALVNQSVSGADLQLAQTGSQISQAQLRLEESMKLYKQAEDALDLQIADTDTKIKQAKANLEAVKSKLDILLEGARPQELGQAQAAYDQAKSNYETAKKDLERGQNLFDQGVIPAQQLDKAKNIYNSAEGAFSIAKHNLSLVKEGPRSQEIEIAKQQVKQAEETLASAESTRSLVEMKKEQLEVAKKQVEEARVALELAQAGVLQNDIKQQQITIARTQFEQAKANYQLAQDNLKLVDVKKKDVEVAKSLVAQREAAFNLAKIQLENSIVKSPVTGTVKLEVAEIGELIPAGSTILKIADVDNIWISVYIPETQYGRIKLKDKAIVTVDSWKGKEFQGYVSYIAKEAQFTPKSIQTKEDRVTLTYEVRVKIDNSEKKLIPGMPADVEILTVNQ